MISSLRCSATFLIILVFIGITHCQIFMYGSRQSVPGVQVQISQTLLNYVSQKQMKNLVKNLGDGRSILQRSGQVKIYDGIMRYTATRMAISNFSEPKSTFEISTKNGMIWELKDIAMTITADWRLNYKSRLVDKTYRANIETIITGGSVAAIIEVDIAEFQIFNRVDFLTRMLNCSFTPAGLKVKYDGKDVASNHPFVGAFEAIMKKEIGKAICAEIDKMASSSANSLINTFEPKVSIAEGKNIYLDYNLIHKPLISNGYVETAHSGEVFYNIFRPAKKPLYPFSPLLVPTHPPTRMVTFYISNHVANTLGYTLQKQGYLHKYLTKNDVPTNFHEHFEMSKIVNDDFRNGFPDLARGYPGAYIELNMTSTMDPFLFINGRSSHAIFTGTLVVLARLQNGSVTELTSFLVQMNSIISLSVRDNKIVGNVVDSRPSFSHMDSNIGDFNDMRIWRVLERAGLTGYLSQQLDVVGQKGLELPSIKGFTLVKPEIKLTQEAVVISADVMYNPEI